MSFTSAVRVGKLRGPQQRNFSLDQWREGFAATGDGSPRDRRLFMAGVWFARRLGSSRKAWGQLARLPLAGSEIARLCVGVVNFATLRKELEPHAPGASDPMSVFGALRRSAVATAENIQHAVESLRIPLANALAGYEPSGAECAARDHESILRGLSQRLILGQHYSGLERLWGDCLWNGWSIEEEGDLDVVMPSELSLELWRAAAHFRRDSLQMEIANRAMLSWKRASTETRRLWSNKPVVVGAKRHAKRLRLELGHVDASNLAPPFAWVAALVAAEEYLESSLDTQLPKLGGVSVRELLSAWWCLAPLAELLAKDMGEISELASCDDAKACAPFIHLNDVVAVLAAALKVEPTKATAIARALLYDGSSRDEVWLKPLVPVEGSWLTPVLESLRSVNVHWAIDVWLNRGGADMGGRGPEFEAHLRRVLTRDTVLPSASVRPEALKLRVGSAFEEIDLVVRIGRTVLLGEAKCSVYPTEPYEFAIYESMLGEAASQVVRKAQFARAHVAELLRQCGWDDLPPEACSIVPVVVTNISLGAGMPLAACPITDVFILRRFLCEGRMSQYATMAEDGTVTGVRESVFYENPTEAERVLEQYLAAPPQLSELVSRVRVGARPLITFEGERSAVFATQHCDPFSDVALAELNGAQSGTSVADTAAGT